VINVASNSIVNRSGAPVSFHTRARATACAPRTASSSPGVVAIRSITRNAVDGDAVVPNKTA